MTLAFCKEILGEIRSKYSEMPIPGNPVTLNGPDLIAQGQQEQENLRQELRETLEFLSYKNLMLERNDIEEIAMKIASRVPTLIYIVK